MERFEPISDGRVASFTVVATTLLGVGALSACVAAYRLAAPRADQLARQRAADAVVFNAKQQQREAKAAARDGVIKDGVKYTSTIKLNTDGCTLPVFSTAEMHASYSDGSRSVDYYSIAHPDGLDHVSVSNANNGWIGTYSLTQQKMVEYFPPIECEPGDKNNG